MRLWQIWLLVMVVSIVFTLQVSALENERLPGVPDSVDYGPATAIDPAYLQQEVLGISTGVYT
jgi:hypothetical protein